MHKKLQNGFFFGLTLTLVFVARFLIEFIKENQVGFEENLTINMGQILSIPYILVGIAFMIYGLIEPVRRLPAGPDS
jgi:prolipoprotein diacylglyceryltransferase